MARIKRIVYDEALDYLTKVTEKLEFEKLNIPTMVTNILDMNRTDTAENIVFTCPFCDQENSVEIQKYNYSHHNRIVTCSCCAHRLEIPINPNDITQSQQYVILGTKINTDGQDIEIVGQYKLYDKWETPERIRVFNYTNFTFYGWDCGTATASVLIVPGYYYSSDTAIVYLDSDTPFHTFKDVIDSSSLKTAKEVGHYTLTNIFRNIIDYFKIERSKIAAKSKTRKPQNLYQAEEAEKYLSLCGLGKEEAEASEQYPYTVLLREQKRDLLHNIVYFNAECPFCKKDITITNEQLRDKDDQVFPADRVNYYAELFFADKYCPHCANDLSSRKFMTHMLVTENIPYIGETVINGEKIIYVNVWSLLTTATCKTYFLHPESALWHTLEPITKSDKLYPYIAENKLPYKYKLETSTAYGNYGVSICCPIISSPTLKYSGIKERFTNRSEISTLLSHISAYLQQPLVEEITKRFPQLLHQVINDIIYKNSNLFDLEAKTITDFFKMSKVNLQTFQKYSLSELKTFQQASRVGEVVDSKYLEYLKSNSVNYVSVERLYEEIPHISLKEITQYLEHCRQYQCIQPRQAAELWADYAMNANKIEMDLNDKKVRRPRSLKMEHDIFAYKYSLIRDQMRREEFVKAVKEDNVYAWHNSKLFIRPPKNLEELFEEGRKLNHCVGTYGDRIIEGRSHIFFIRWNDTPDAPYFTLELVGKTVTQIHGYGDCNPGSNTSELNKFIKEWKTKFDLR